MLRTCSTCGLGQVVPDIPTGMRACCARCGTSLLSPLRRFRSSNRTAAVALAALILYPLAISLPILRIEQFGHASDSSILSGIIQLLSTGNYFVGMIVLFCSVVFPLFKLVSLLLLSLGGLALAHRHRALTWRLIEWTGRWGMLDVLLVAILVAALKLGDTFQVTPGPGAVAFTLVVLLSLLATASFDPQAMWKQQR